jgi:hypothetical protein
MKSLTKTMVSSSRYDSASHVLVAYTMPFTLRSNP